MSNAKNINKKEAEDVCKSLLKGTFLSGFRYEMNFVLVFSHNAVKIIENEELPLSFEIHIMDELQIGNEENWCKKTNTMIDNRIVEPLEPLRAYEITSLLYKDNTIVQNIQILENCLAIIFENGEVIRILLQNDDEYSFILKEHKSINDNEKWSLVYEVDTFYAKLPIKIF